MNTMQKVYMDAQAGCGLKVGDFVKVLRKAEDYEGGWDNIWIEEEMTKFIGKIGQIMRDYNSGGYRVKFQDNWFSFPYFVLEKMSYAEIHNKSNLKIGDKVKITRAAKDYEGEWNNVWNPNMDNYVEQIGTVTGNHGEKGFRILFNDGGQWKFPCFVLKKVKKEAPKKPKFKVGDKVRVARASDNDPWISSMMEYIGKESVISEITEANKYMLPACNWLFFPEDSLELVEEKPECPFKPFDKVLVSDNNDDRIWHPALFSHYKNNSSYPFRVIAAGLCCWKQCIPYEGNEHLCGTSNQAE